MYRPGALLRSVSVAVLLVAVAATASAQESSLQVRVAVGPMSAPADDAALAAICTAVRSTVSLTLRLLGTYRVTDAPEVDPYADEHAALGYLADSHVDNLIYGRAQRDEAGAVVLELSVLDRERGKVTITRSEKAATSLDVFDAADSLSVGLLQAFSGIHIGFGEVDLVGDGEQGTYTVVVDGVEAGQTVTRLSKLLNGHHVVEVRQQRMLGQAVLLRQEVDVVEESTVRVAFTVPYLLPDEAEALASVDRKIAAAWEDRSAGAAVTSLLARAEGLLTDVSYSPRLGELLPGYRQKRGEHTLLENRWRIEARRFSPDVGLGEELATLREEASGYPRPEALAQSAGENASLLVSLLRVSADRQLAEGRCAIAEATVEAAARLIPLTTEVKAGLFSEEREYLQTVLAGYEARKKQTPRLLGPFAVAAIGAALSGLSGWLFADGTSQRLAAQGTALYQSYQASTDPTELSQLHQSIQTTYLWANVAEWTKWGGAVLGPATLGLGIGLAVREWTAATRYLRSNIAGFFSGRMEAAKAALAVETRNYAGTLVMTDPPGLPVSVGGAPVEATPAATLAARGKATKVTSTDRWLGELTGTLEAEGGSTVLLLHDGSGREPAGPELVMVKKLAGKRYEVSWTGVPGAASYSVEIDRAGGDYSAPVEIKHGLKGERLVYTAPQGVTGKLQARVCAFDASGTRSRWDGAGEQPTADEPATSAGHMVQTGKVQRKGFSLEPQVGMAWDGSLYPELGAAFVYQFSDWFSLGAWGGTIADEPAFLPSGGLRLFVGNKVDGLALLVDLGFYPGLGLCYRGFFAVAEVFTVPWLVVGFRAGYSFFLGKR